MESWAIFTHAVRMVFQNFGDAIKITGVLYLAMFAAKIVLVGTSMADFAAVKAAMAAGTMPWGAVALYVLIAIVLSIWAVVGWHRYVLLEERPALVLKLLPANMLSYFWRTILVTLIVIVPAAIAALGGVFFALAGALGGEMGIFFGAIGASMFGIAVAVLIAYRLSPMFPSAALGNPMSFGDAWGKLRGKNGMLFALMLISAVAALILSIPTFILEPVSLVSQVFAFIIRPILSIPTFILEPVSLVAQVFAFIIGWVQLTVGASIITTLYGVYVEGRELPRS